LVLFFTEADFDRLDLAGADLGAVFAAFLAAVFAGADLAGLRVLSGEDDPGALGAGVAFLTGFALRLAVDLVAVVLVTVFLLLVCRRAGVTAHAPR
jgi:uncharacterized protein YjbI with pentapeptide repeats